MNIIPYDEQILTNADCLMKPNGSIIYTYNNLEKYASDYVKGKDYSYLSMLKTYNNEPSIDRWWKEYKEKHNCQGKREDIDLFLTSSLAKEELELYKLWLESNNSKQCSSEFLIHVLGFDKMVSTIIYNINRIYTTSIEPHVKYYNYCLMDFPITCVPIKKYNLERKQFEIVSSPFIASKLDEEYAEEIKEIREKVLKKDRFQYFR